MYDEENNYGHNLAHMLIFLLQIECFTPMRSGCKVCGNCTFKTYLSYMIV